MRTKILLLVLMIAVAKLCNAIELKVLTFNIGTDDPQAANRNWSERKDAVINQITTNKPDIFCLQEVMLNQVNDIAAYMPGFDWSGVGRDNGITQGEYSPIFYNSQKYQLKKQGWFWMSETPDKPTIGWDADFPLICNYVLLEDYNTHDNFLVFNTRLNNMGDESAKKSAKLILDKIQGLSDKKLPVVLTGIFETAENEDPVQTIEKKLDDCREESLRKNSGSKDIEGNNFRLENYIFVNKRVVLNQFNVISDLGNMDNIYLPSPICVEILID